MKKLVLFDIDGTIMNTDGGGAISCQRALETLFDRPVSLDNYQMSGKTDTQIVLELMEREGVARDVTMGKLDAICELYIEGLEREVVGWDPEICPGISPLLDRLSEMSDVLLGLLTGNIERGARVKLNRVGLWDYFKTGAFGDRTPERHMLPGVAQRIAEEQTGQRFVQKDIVVIGDTPNDILCGRDLDVKAIAVATGSFDLDTLASYDPDYLFEDLSDTDGVIEAVME
ncbi:MAG: HAD hydrolase-like protein [Candidatus Latescibacteria bacterium]|nr:HAD hydrolase-like protein [Candidatus Latescibacterota bacterium]